MQTHQPLGSQQFAHEVLYMKALGSAGKCDVDSSVIGRQVIVFLLRRLCQGRWS